MVLLLLVSWRCSVVMESVGHSVLLFFLRGGGGTGSGFRSEVAKASLEHMYLSIESIPQYCVFQIV